MTKISNDEEKEVSRAEALRVLHQRILNCRLCEEHGYIPKAQPLTSGRARDRIMVIGQAPGHRSVANGRSFSGPGGRILQKWLEQAGFPPGYLHSHTYLSSLTHCDPGRNPRGDGDRRPSPQEVALCRPFLEAELQLLQPKVVLLVGSMAIETFFGKVIERFGADRIAWGSNFPNSVGTLKEILTAAQKAFSFAKASDQDWIFGKTAQVLYPVLKD